MNTPSDIRYKLLGISRSHRFSPNSTGRDEAIFMSVANRLQRLGCEVSIISEDMFITADLSEFSLVFSMARGNDVLKELAYSEHEQGLKVMNSAACLLDSSRTRLVKKLADVNIQQPATVICDPMNDNCLSMCSRLKKPLWIKRGDTCAQSASDVRFVQTNEELQDAIELHRQNNVSSICIAEHAEGDLIKFYGVGGSDFFYCYYPTESNGFSKFGLEEYNSRIQHYPFDVQKLKDSADKASSASGFTIYGGDAIIKHDGSVVIIDFNDWPSFSPCRKEASKAIAQRIYQELQ